MLVRCSECGHKVSSDAKVCPKCGAPIDGFSLMVKDNLDSGLASLIKESKPENVMRNIIIYILVCCVISGVVAFLLFHRSPV